MTNAGATLEFTDYLGVFVALLIRGLDRTFLAIQLTTFGNILLASAVELVPDGVAVR